MAYVVHKSALRIGHFFSVGGAISSKNCVDGPDGDL